MVRATDSLQKKAHEGYRVTAVPIVERFITKYYELIVNLAKSNDQLFAVLQQEAL